VAAVAALAVLAIASPRSLAGAGAFAMAGWLLASSAIEIRKRRGARMAAFAAAIAHAGLAVSLMGIAGTTVWRSEALTVLGPGDKVTVGPYTLRFNGVSDVDGPNYKGRRATIDLMDGNAVKATMRPEQRIYNTEGQDVSVTAIRTTGLRDLYLALGDDRGNGRWSLRAYVSPLAPLIWLGALVMALGGALSLFARLRAKAPEPKPAPAVAMAAE
jgi:cytochrome c-type biogenesis protein CcmF